MELFDGLNLDDLEQVAQIVYNNRLVDIFRDSNIIYVSHQDQLTQVPFTETILKTLHNVFENHLIFELVNFLLFEKKGEFTEASKDQKEGVLESTWSSQLIPFQLFLK